MSVQTSGTTGLKIPYINVLAYKADRSAYRMNKTFTAQDEELFKTLASDPNIYEKIARNIAPAIYGNSTILTFRQRRHKKSHRMFIIRRQHKNSPG